VVWKISLVISSICGDIVKHLYHRFHAFLEWDSQRLTGQKLKQYADVIKDRSGVDAIWGFLDETLKPISRPLDDQRLHYSGHKHHYGIKYIGVVTPDGLISCLSRPFVGRRDDWYAWESSGIAQYAEEALLQNNPIERLYYMDRINCNHGCISTTS
jgi:nuclease HARBI1